MVHKKKDLLTILGRLLVFFGVMVWGVYALVRWGFGWEVTDRQFLPYHLAGVIPGMILGRRKLFATWIKKIFS